MSKRLLEAEHTRMAKVQRPGEQHPPFLFIDDVLSEMLELNGFVAPLKIDAFENIVNKLLGTEILVQKKQADADLPFIFVEDVITDLRANIDLYVGQEGKTIFEKILEKMQSNKLPPPVLFIDDVVSQILELDGYVAIEKNGAFQNNVNKLKGTKILVQKKQADADLSYVFIEEVISEMRANIDRYVGQVGKNLFEKIFEAMKSKRLVRKRTGNQNLNREEIIVEVDRTRFVAIDPPKEERLDNYGEVVMNSDVDGMQNNAPYAKQELVEVDEQQPNVPEAVVVEPVDAAMELNGSISEKNSEQSDIVESPVSNGEDDEEPLSAYLVRKLGRLPHGELINIIMHPEYNLRDPANAALLSKQERIVLDIIVNAIDKPVMFSVIGEVFQYRNYGIGLDNEIRARRKDAIKQEVILNEGDGYLDGLACLIATLLGSYEVFPTCLEFKTLNFGERYQDVMVPFEKYFEQRTNRINIYSLKLNNCELAPLLRFVCPKELYVGMPSTCLFDKDDKLMIIDVRRIVMGGDHIDNVDKIFEQWQKGQITLGPNSEWSDCSVKKVLTMMANNGGNMLISCYYFKRDVVKAHQRTIPQWKALFSDWRSSHAVSNSVRCQVEVSKPTIVFCTGNWAVPVRRCIR